MKRVAEAVPYTRYACLELSFRETNRNDGRAVFYARPCKIAVWIPAEQISYHFRVFSEYSVRGTVKFIKTKRRFVVNNQAVRLNYDERHKTNLTNVYQIIKDEETSRVRSFAELSVTQLFPCRVTSFITGKQIEIQTNSNIFGKLAKNTLEFGKPKYNSN